MERAKATEEVNLSGTRDLYWTSLWRERVATEGEKNSQVKGQRNYAALCWVIFLSFFFSDGFV